MTHLFLQIASIFQDYFTSGERVEGYLRKWAASLAALLQLCRLLRAACLHTVKRLPAHAVQHCPAWLSVQSSSSLWMLFLGVHYRCSARPWVLLSKWGEMGRNENPESVEQWDIGFKSFMAISKGFYSWCCARYIYRASSIELECNCKSRFVCLWRKETVKVLMSRVFHHVYWL